MARKKKQQSTEPKKPGRLAQIRQVYKAAHQVDRLIGWWMLLAFLATLVVAVGIGVLVGHWVYALFLGLPLALLAATLVLSRRAERAAYRSIEGQPGASGAALGALRKGWYYDQQPIAIDATKPNDMVNAAFVFRAVGRPGVVLIGEGPKARVSRLLEAERKKVARVAPGVPITLLHAGDGEDQVPVRKLSGKLRRLKGTLTKQEVSVVNKRLKSLGGMKLPVPAGMDPTRARVDRKAMRGR
jgi:Domain of unknown function (DUF4191)